MTTKRRTFNDADRLQLIYNNVRPHTSLDYMTPNDAYRETGLIKRRWKNCYSSGNYNNEDVITLLTR